MESRFTKLVGCRFPVQLAAMGGVGTTELARAVEQAGGCGMVPASEEAAPGACGINFILAGGAPSPAMIRQLARKARVTEFFYGSPQSTLVDAAHQSRSVVGWQVGSAEEAAAAEAAGCDFVVAQGTEAGGHVRGTQSLEQVLREVLAQVRIPVVAAGGIATAERVAELMALGAEGVRVGTRFVTCPESGAHQDYVRNLLAASADDTIITEWFGQGWEHAPHRVLRPALEAAQRTGWRASVPPYRGINRSATDMAQYAGTGVGEVTRSQPAAEVVADLVRLL